LRKFTRPELSGALRELRSSLNSVLNYSFFRTKSMRIELNEGRMTGTLPILMVFMARSGKTIYDVSFFDLTSDGIMPARKRAVSLALAGGADQAGGGTRQTAIRNTATHVARRSLTMKYPVGILATTCEP
jgi:hypothetical protein